MKQIFLSTSFSGKVDEQTGWIVPEFRAFIEEILVGIRKHEMADAFCAVEHEGWMIANDVPPETGVKQDLEKLDASEALVALVHDKPSVGVQFEIGYAVAQGKQVILAHHADDDLAYFNQGLVSGGYITAVSYDDVESLVQQLTVALHAPDDDVAA